MEVSQYGHLEASSRKPWGGLSDELLVEVLKYRLILLRPINTITHESHLRRALLPLLLTDRRTHNIALEIYYGGNRFILFRGKLTERSRDPTLLLPPFHIGKWLRHLELRLYVRSDPLIHSPDDDLEAWLRKPEFRLSDWLVLVRPRQRPKSLHMRSPASKMTCDQSNWQDHFTSLKTLKIVLSLERCLTIKEKHYMELTPSKAKIDVTANAVEVIVATEGTEQHKCTGSIRRHDKGPPDPEDLPSCPRFNCSCATVIENTIRSMIPQKMS